MLVSGVTRPLFKGGPRWTIAPPGGTWGPVNFQELFYD